MEIFVLEEVNNTHHEPICPPDYQRKCRCGILDESVQGKAEKVDVSMECDERKSPNGLDYRRGTEEEHDCNIDKQKSHMRLEYMPRFFWKRKIDPGYFFSMPEYPWAIRDPGRAVHFKCPVFLGV